MPGSARNALRLAGNSRRGARQRLWRRHAGCGRARNSRDRPRRAARHRGSPRPALHRRPARQKLGVIRRDRLYRGLLQHDLRQPHPVRVRRLAARLPATAARGMAVVPGQQISRIGRASGFLPPWRSDCYAHGADVGMRCTVMNNPSRSFPRPLADFVGAALGDASRRRASPRPKSCRAGPTSSGRRSPLIASRSRSTGRARSATTCPSQPRWCCGWKARPRSKSSISPR